MIAAVVNEKKKKNEIQIYWNGFVFFGILARGAAILNLTIPSGKCDIPFSDR